MYKDGSTPQIGDLVWGQCNTLQHGITGVVTDVLADNNIEIVYSYPKARKSLNEGVWQFSLPEQRTGIGPAGLFSKLSNFMGEVHDTNILAHQSQHRLVPG